MGVEIKVTDDFVEQLGALKRAANDLKTGCELDAIEATATTQEFAKRYERLQGILEAYKELLIKDVNELERFCQDMKKLDESGS